MGVLWRSSFLATSKPSSKKLGLQRIPTWGFSFSFFFFNFLLSNLSGMSIVILRGNSLKSILGLGFFLIQPPRKSPQNEKCYFHSKEGQYTYSNQLANLESLFYDFFGKFCILRQRCHKCAPSTWIYTHHHMSNYIFQRLMFKICWVWVSFIFLDQLEIIGT